MQFKTLSFLWIGLWGLLCSQPLAAQQTDRAGAYEINITKDDFSAKMKLYVYNQEGQTYARLRVAPNTGNPWEVNLWSLKNGEYLDFYYEYDPEEETFIQDVHIMTLSGKRENPMAVYGSAFKEKIPQLKPVDLLTRVGDDPNFPIKERAKSQTVEVKGEQKKK